MVRVSPEDQEELACLQQALSVLNHSVEREKPGMQDMCGFTLPT